MNRKGFNMSTKELLAEMTVRYSELLKQREKVKQEKKS